MKTKMKIKTKLEGLNVIVKGRPLKIGDSVYMETSTKNSGHGRIYEVIGIKNGVPNERSSYYTMRRDDNDIIEVEAGWFDNCTRTTYLIEEGK